MKIYSTILAMISAIFLLSIDTYSADAENACSRARAASPQSSGLTDRYIELVCLAEDKFAAGEFDAARVALMHATGEFLFESPNYEPLLRLAEIACIQGDHIQGISLLREFNCMLDVEVGDRQCFPDDPHNGTSRIGENVSLLCYQNMCGEMFLSYYQSPTEAMIDTVDSMRMEVTRVAQACIQE